MMASNQIHGLAAFDRPAFLPGDPNPSLRVQFHAPVRFENIRGQFHFSYQLEAPAVVWGHKGRCWAFLHDFDQRSLGLIMENCRQATYERRGAYANPFPGRW
jgi:hypothetical protein